MGAAPVRSAIIPLLIGEEAKALAQAAALREKNIFLPAIRYPTVARGQARLRLTVTASHAAEDIARWPPCSAKSPKFNRPFKIEMLPWPNWTAPSSGIPSRRCGIG